jgi:DNA-binding MarR family transcriptional regulator
MKRPNDRHSQYGSFPGSIDDQLKFLEHLVKSRPPKAIEQSMGFLLASAMTRMRIVVLKKIKEYGYDVTPEQGMVLNAVEDSEGISQSEIAERTMKDKPTITRILDILEKKKLITRHSDAADRRIFKIYLTDTGREKIAVFRKIIAEVDKRAFMGLSANDMKILKRFLSSIRSNLE